MIIAEIKTKQGWSRAEVTEGDEQSLRIRARVAGSRVGFAAFERLVNGTWRGPDGEPLRLRLAA